MPVSQKISQQFLRDKVQELENEIENLVKARDELKTEKLLDDRCLC